MSSDRSSDQLSKARQPVYQAKFRRYATRFLRKPVKNAAQYWVARIGSKLPLLSAGIRTNLARSAEKRDYKSFARVLKAIPSIDQDVAQHFFEKGIKEGATDLGEFDRNMLATDPERDFRNTHINVRSHVLGERWHIEMVNAVQAPPERLRTMELPRITISFVTYNSQRWLDGLFQTLQGQSYPLDHITLRFVDHGSGDDTVAVIRNFFEGAGKEFAGCHLTERENAGFGAGHDFNIRASDDTFVLVSNVDLEFAADTLLRLMSAASSDASDVACWEMRQCPYEHPKYYDPVKLETAWSSHACILIRREAYQAVGGYEPRIFMYGEDVELSYRFRRAGYKLRYLPGIAIRHFVDFEDTTLRPNQLSGSLASNVLLRYRYGGQAHGVAGEYLLNGAIASEASPERQQAMMQAQDIVEKHRAAFQNGADGPQDQAGEEAIEPPVFPFNNLDYDLTRQGFDVALDSLSPLQHRPLVTVVTRTHGPALHYLREAITSVLNQTYGHVEHLIVEDRTRFAEALVSDMAEAYGANIRYVRNQGVGRSDAGNTGLAEAKGELIMFLDNDDHLFADHIELLVRELAAHPDAVASYALAWDIPVHFTASGGYREMAPLLPEAHMKPYDPLRFQKGNFIPIQAIMFRRSVYEAEGGFDPEIDHLEDWNLWARYAKHGPFHMVSKTTSTYKTPADPEFRKRRDLIMRKAGPFVKTRTFPDI